MSTDGPEACSQAPVRVADRVREEEDQMRTLLTALVLVCLVSAAPAAFVTGFEPPDYTAGVALTGQQGWYVPSGTDYFVYTYAASPYFLEVNPNGDEQFIAGESLGDPNYARAEHTYDWGSNDVWVVMFDVAALYDGVLPAQDYLGSFSLQPSTTARYFQTLNIWNSLDAPTTYRTAYITQEFAVPGTSPGPAWDTLLATFWYRQKTVFRMPTNEILEVGITDLSTGTQTNFRPVGWHLADTTGGGVLPTGMRFFAGGATGGNVDAWDNLTVVVPGDVNCDGSIDAFDIDPFVLALTDPVAYGLAYPLCDLAVADVNFDGAVDAFDIDPFVALLTGD
jgi:hypothetical protein